MTWTTDGSGLQVKRIRGRTMPQRRAAWDTAVAIWRAMRIVGRQDRAARRDERIARSYRKWDRYSLSPTTPRRTERRWMREALEGAARKLGLEVRPGEFSRDLRARVRGLMEFTTSREGIGSVTDSQFFQAMTEAQFRGYVAERMGVDPTATPNAIMVHRPSEGGTVDEFQEWANQKTSRNMNFPRPIELTRRELRDLRLVDVAEDGTRTWARDSLERIPGVTYPIEALPMELSDEEYRRRALEVVKRRTAVPPKAWQEEIYGPLDNRLDAPHSKEVKERIQRPPHK